MGMNEIRKRINEVVYDKHLSNRAFSAMVGMKPTSVNNYLKFQFHKGTIKTCHQICYLLSVSISIP